MKCEKLRKISIYFFSFLMCIMMSKVIISDASTNGHTQAEAVEWVNSLVRNNWGTLENTPNYDGTSWVVGDWGEPQCVDLIVAYWDYLTGSHRIGNAYDYYDIFDLPPGWTYAATPTAGDIMVINKGASYPYGHVGIVVSVNNDGKFNFVDTNGDFDYIILSNGKRLNTGASLRKDKAVSSNMIFIHPDFVDSAPDPVRLDVNGLLDEQEIGNLDNYGTVDVYINGNRVADDVTDYYVSWPVGTNYEIRDIKPKDGKEYVGIRAGTRTGTLNANKEVCFGFNTVPDTLGVKPIRQMWNGHTYFYVS